MRAGLDRAPVVAGGDRDRVDAVHDALVVRRGTVSVDARDIVGKHDGIAHRRAVVRAPGQVADGEPGSRRDQRAVGQVGQDAQRHVAVAPARDLRRQRLANRVDKIRAHRIHGVDKEVHGQQRPAIGQSRGADHHPYDPAAALGKPRMNRVGPGEQRRPARFQRPHGGVDVGHTG